MTTKSNTIKWVSYILQGIVSAMFLMGAVMNIIGAEDSVKQSMEMGYAASTLLPLGIVLLVAVLLYIWPKTSILGAAFITAWLGGAVATHVIHGDPISKSIPAVVFGVLVWLAIWLRNDKVRSVFPVFR